jgi:hypothetical protein
MQRLVGGPNLGFYVRVCHLENFTCNLVKPFDNSVIILKITM